MTSIGTTSSNPGTPPSNGGAARFPALAPLRHRDYALVFSAAFISSVGSWLQAVAVGILVTQLTGQAGWTGLVAAAAFLPLGLLSPIGGAMADRVDRRRWLVWTTVGETTFAAALAAVTATGHISAPLLSLLVLGGGSFTALAIPAFQAVLPDLVPREELLAASSLSLAQFNLGRVVGPALAGVVLAVGSFTWAFALNAVSFGAVIIALLIVKLPPAAAPTEEGGIWTRIRTGARAARADDGCRLAITTIAVVAILMSPFIALIPAVAAKLFHHGEAGTSVLITAQGVGAVGGALLLASLATRFGRQRVLVWSLVVLPLTLIGYAASPNLAAGTLALVAVGMTYVGVLSGLGTVVQLRAPTELRARILSLYMVALGVIYPLGAVVHGFIGDRIGLRTVTAGGAVLFLVIAAAARGARPHLPDAFEDVMAPTAPAPAPELPM